MIPSEHRRVLMLIENQPFPRDVRVFPEAQALLEMGYQVSVIAPASPGQPRREKLNGIYVCRYPAPPSSNGFAGYVLEYVYSFVATFVISLCVSVRPGFDIIHAANPPDTTVFIALLFRLFNKRFIFDHHDLTPELYNARFNNKDRRFIYKILIGLEKLSCRLADHVIATNQSYRDLEIMRDNISESRITVVRNGPNLELFKAATPDPRLRKKGAVMICYVGTMALQDGVDYLLRAIKCLVVDLNRTDFYCYLVGDGDAFESLLTQAEDLRLAEYLIFTGQVPQSEVARYISSADICVAPEPSNPYNDRSTMIKIMEYMASAKPIVAFDLPEHRFSAQDAALYAHPNDELDFARKIAILMDDVDGRRKMGQKGRKRVEKELAWSHQKISLIEVYEKLFSG